MEHLTIQKYDCVYAQGTEYRQNYENDFGGSMVLN